MGTRQDWAATLVSNSGAATGDWFIHPGGRTAFTFSGTVTDVDIEIKDVAGAAVALDSTLTGVNAVKTVSFDVPPGQVRTVVNTGTAVYVRATKVPE